MLDTRACAVENGVIYKRRKPSESWNCVFRSAEGIETCVDCYADTRFGYARG